MILKEFKGLARFVGLMFKKVDPDVLYVFRFKKLGKYPVHTWFMKETIDVAWFDNNGVIEAKTLKPWSYASHKNKAIGFCEVKSGEVYFAGQN